MRSAGISFVREPKGSPYGTVALLRSLRKLVRPRWAQEPRWP